MIQPLNPFSTNPVSFGYKSILKDEFKTNPEMREHVKRGLYGGKLTRQDVTLEHVQPHSKGGGQNLGNMALATKALNEARGSDPLPMHLTKPMVDRYTKQFEGWQAQRFDNKQYVQELRRTIQGEGVNLDIPDVKIGKVAKRMSKQAKKALRKATEHVRGRGLTEQTTKGLDVGTTAKQIGSDLLEHSKEIVKHIDFKA